MDNPIEFIVLGRPEPQGSMKGFVLPGKNGAKPRAILTSANSKMKPYRQQVGWAALDARAKAGCNDVFAGKQVAVRVELKFFLEKPQSISKKRTQISVKPDIDKLCRSTIDAMTGVMFADDSQIVQLSAAKFYGVPERVEIVVTNLELSESHKLF